MMKREEERVEEEVRVERNQIINRNMFEDDRWWDLCCEDLIQFKSMQQEDNSTHQEELTTKKTLYEVKMELASLIPTCEKQSVFEQSFVGFSYHC